MSFRNLIQNQIITEQEILEYNEALNLFEHPELLTEGILDKLSAGIKSKLEFMKNLADKSKASLEDLVLLFKNTKVFKFFKYIKFNLGKLFSLLKQGYKFYNELQNIIAKYVASTKVVKWTKEHLNKLDLYLQEHPKLKKFSGVAVSALLLYIWLNMSFGGNLEFDMSFDDMLNALMGKFSLSDLFASDSGVRMLLLLASGTLLGLSFPWPGPTSVHLVTGVVVSLQKLVRKRL